jgi:hypothetical protein
MAELEPLVNALPVRNTLRNTIAGSAPVAQVRRALASVKGRNGTNKRPVKPKEENPP